MGVMPWSPLKSGFLSGKFSRRNSSPVDSARSALVGVPSERDYDVIDVLERVAGRDRREPGHGRDRLGPRPPGRVLHAASARAGSTSCARTSPRSSSR